MNLLKELIQITDHITVDISGSNDGFFIEDPIVIHSAENNDIVSLEWFILKYNFRTQNVLWRKKAQQLIRENNKVIDKIEIEIKQNEEIHSIFVHFDITEVFGK